MVSAEGITTINSRRATGWIPAGNRRSIRNVAVAVVGVALVLPPALAADAATEPDILPVDGVFDLQGRGYGHGRGMSQWGAQGAATLGVPYQDILRFYYPGTNLSIGDDDDALKVHITGDNDGDLTVRPGQGLRVRSDKDSRMLPTKIGGRTVSAWRVVKLSGGQLRLKGRAGGKWHTVTVDGKSKLVSPVRLRTKPSDGIQVVISGSEERHYRGQMYAYADARTQGALKVVNKVKMGDYLRSVVPSESFPTWAPAALQAQSVAARSYALWKIANNPLGFADICDTTACQVYHGSRRYDGNGDVDRVWEAATTSAAVLATAGRTLRYDGKPALTEFSASNGGYSTDGRKPYLIARPDPWDGVVANAAHAWDMDIKASTISKAYPELGKITKLRVTDRDGNGPWGGRVLEVKLYGTKKNLTVNGFSFASKVGLRHSWWRGKGVVPTETATAEPQVEVDEAPKPQPTPEAPVAPEPVAPEQPSSPEDPEQLPPDEPAQVDENPGRGEPGEGEPGEDDGERRVEEPAEVEFADAAQDPPVT